MTQCFKELAGSPEEHWGPEGFRATRQIVVPWANRNAMALELRGSGYEFSGPDQTQYPDAEFIKAVRVKSAPWVNSPKNQGAFNEIASELQTYDFAHMTIEYELVPTPTLEFPLLGDGTPTVDPETFLTYSMDFGGDFMTLPKQFLVWENDPLAPIPEEVKATLRLPIIEHRLSWSRVSSPPWEAIRKTIGLVNNGVFIGLGEEELLFEGCRAMKEFITLDELQAPEYGWKLDYLFRQRTIQAWEVPEEGGPERRITHGWNHFWKPIGGQGWDRIINAFSQGMYGTADFNLLFNQATE